MANVIRRRYDAGPVRIDGGIDQMVGVAATTGVGADIPLSAGADPPPCPPSAPAFWPAG
jgi:hypothetical protein